MKGSHAIHWILVWVLCLGQVVANAHIIGHIGSDGVTENTQAHHLSTHTGKHSHEHHGALLAPQGPSSDNENSDCVVYHAYAGLAAITPAVNNAVAIEPVRSFVIRYRHSNLYSGLANTQPIRGPPTYS